MTSATRVSRVEIKLLLFKICKKPGNVYKITEDSVKKQVLPHLEDNSMNIINRIRKLRHVSQEVSRMLLTNKCNGRSKFHSIRGEVLRCYGGRVIICLNLILRMCAQIVTSSLNCALHSHLHLESSIWSQIYGWRIIFWS